MLDRTMVRPKPSRAGSAVGGPPASIQSRTRASPLVRQVTASVPASVDSAPSLPALVAGSCSANATAGADAVLAVRLAGSVAHDDAGAVAQADLAARSHEAEFALEAGSTHGDEVAHGTLLAIVGMHHRLDALDGRLEMGRVYAEDAIRAFVPLDMTRRQIDLPRAHVACRQRGRAALLSSSHAPGLRLHLRSAAHCPPLQP